jgi:hypothetical protein
VFLFIVEGFEAAFRGERQKGIRKRRVACKDGPVQIGADHPVVPCTLGAATVSIPDPAHDPAEG